MGKILGIDLGTNSIGLTVREDNEFDWFGVYTFKTGVGSKKGVEFSYAAERTKHRSSRRLYNARRYRKWETLKVLIKNDFCPLTYEELKKWKDYEKGVGRVFPLENEEFNQWIKLDFNYDNKPDYKSPYQLRRELIQKTLDLSDKTDRYKIGRALYHIAQRRGFQSSRKLGDKEKSSVYKGGDGTTTVPVNEYKDLIKKYGSLGAAFAYLEDAGVRIRNRYTLRKDYKKEVKKIIDIQNIDSDFSAKILKAIFFQRPLRSQKGLIGKCTLEKNKYRCPVSHPKFEAFRAWAFINTIKYKDFDSEKFEPLPIELKQKLYRELFFKQVPSFKFMDVRKFISANGGENRELNYKKKLDKTNVSGCPVSAKFKAIFGEEWENVKIEYSGTDKEENEVTKTYKIEDIWHLLFSFEDEEIFKETIAGKLRLDEGQVKQMMTLWNSFPVGYANLSLKAINNILPFLQEGLIYTEAVLLAKIPELIGKKLFAENKELLINQIKQEIANNREEKQIINITNNLISKYKSLNFQEQFAYKNTEYKLDKSDYSDIEQATTEHFGKNRWQKLPEEDKKLILERVAKKYQAFFATEPRSYINPPHLLDQIKKFIKDNFKIEEKNLQKLYHPSQIAIYSKIDDQIMLNSPKTAAFKNPMAYKALHHLRRVINHLIEIGKIDNETRIVVEIARDLNDKNKRAAIETYQRRRERENDSYAYAISELLKDPNFSGDANPEKPEDKRKFRLWTEQIENLDEVDEEISKIEKDKKLSVSEKDIKKYRLWKEQNCQCMYTGDIINLTDLFNPNTVDFEHTIPRSKSFDNSLANLTVCYADYNRNIKDNQIPTELDNYKENALGYTAIYPRLENWQNRVDELKEQIDFWKLQSKIAGDKDRKDYTIRQRHLRTFEYDYWKDKVDRFTIEDVPQGFVRSQLTDTQIISKYAFHYLKTVFNKVEVQKGDVTAQFRKIYGIQEKTKKKDRSKHHHHAIDAAVLTLIPKSAKREEILKKAYEYEQKTKKQYHEKPFPAFHQSMITEIEKTLLINNIPNKDQALTKGKKIVRRRGKIVWLRDKNGKIELDKKGNKIPKIAQGDSIRGQLHEESFYGLVKVVEKDKDNKPLRDKDGNFIFKKDKSGKNEFWVVKRILAKDLTVKNNKINNDIVDEHLKTYMEEQLEEGVKVFDLLDFNNKKIRHVRCRVKAGRGNLNANSLIKIKEQTNKSKAEYKNFYYAKPGDNYLFGLYETNDGKNRDIKSVNLFEAGQINNLSNVNDKKELFEEKIHIGTKKQEASLIHIFEIGQKILFFRNNKKELKEITYQELSERLYFVKRLHQASVGNILFQHHLEARSDEQLQKDFPSKIFKSAGKYGFSKFQTDFIAPRLLFKPTKNNFIIEEKDFEISLDGKIEFLF